MINSFFINKGGFGGSGSGSLVKIEGDKILVDMPLDFYIDSNDNVFVGGKENNAILMQTIDNKIFARKAV